jgi:single-stranded-DNA-specific exonuclease
MNDSRNRLFLDVERSAKGMAWRDRLSPAADNVALQIEQEQGLPAIVSRVLAARGVVADHALKFLDPTLRDLMPDPLSLTAMRDAADRIAQAVRKREKVAILGDYDVDGAASSALLWRYLAHFGIDAEIYIPDRIFEGYGPNDEAMRGLADRGATLIITVDCGTNSTDPIAAAYASGAEVVVLDHHQVSGDLPQCVAVVNPNREDDISGQGHLCAAGVVFVTLAEVNRTLRKRGIDHALPDLLSFLDLVAMATVCDVVPLVGVNRAFVTKGLLAARARGNIGLAALTDAARIGEPLNTFHFGFLLGPRINAGGRIGDAALGARLLTIDEAHEAQKIAADLDRLNQERQAMERDMLAQALDEAEAERVQGKGPAIMVTAHEDWHPGIVGLIAARIKEKTRHPAIAIAIDVNGRGTGSARSIAGIDIGKLVRGAMEKGILIKGGGHAMAAGLTIEREKLGDLRSYLEEQVADDVARIRAEECLNIDAALAADGATLEMMSMLERAGPYGSAHPEPVFAFPRHRVTTVKPVGHDHLKVVLRSQTGKTIDAIAFRSAETPLGQLLLSNMKSELHVAGTLSINYWNGRKNVQLRIIDAALPA